MKNSLFEEIKVIVTYPIGPKFNETINTTANKNIAFFLPDAFCTFDN